MTRRAAEGMWSTSPLSSLRPRGWLALGPFCAIVVAVAVAALGAERASASEDPRTIGRFLEELNAHGLHDIALEYIDDLRSDPDVSTDLKATLDYQEGQTLIDEASKTGDLVLREELLKEARDKLEGFVKAHGDRSEARTALVHMAKILIERGHLAMLKAEDETNAAAKEAKRAEARAAFTRARAAYDRAVNALGEALAKLPVSMPRDDPRKPERDALYTAHLDAMLQMGVAEYEQAQTYPAGAGERTRLLKTALDEFQKLYNDHRSEMGGLTAQMWQAKCYEELGDIGSAIGLYKQLLRHTDAHLRVLQRNVGYFYIVALARRKQFALAADEAVRWMATYNRPGELQSNEGMGVSLELARAIDAQMPSIAANGRAKAVKEIVDNVARIVRYASPYKKDALALLKKYRPSVAVKAEDLARLKFPAVMAQADEAIGMHDWDRAAVLLKAAIGKVDPARETDNLNLARYNLAFARYMNKDYYEAAVLGEHLARRYPKAGLAPKAAEIAMQSLADAYNTYTELDREADLDALIDVSRYAAKTWPEREEGDAGRFNLGMIHAGRGDYDAAIEAFGSVRRKSNRWYEAQARLGSAHWFKGRVLERRGDARAAAGEVKKAVAILRADLAERRKAGVAPTDPGLVGNVKDLAIVLTETGKADEAVKLLAPVVKAQTQKTGPVYSRLLEAQLRAFITTNQVEQAIATMKSLESAGGGDDLAQLYFKLGRLLQQQLDALHARGDTATYNRIRQAYKAFLTTLAQSKTGQTYDSLQWAGEGLLDLGAEKEAEAVFRRVLKEFTQDPQFLQKPGGRAHLLRTRLKLAAALREQGKFDEAATIIDDLLEHKETARYIEPRFEKGLLLEAQAADGRGEWSAALRHWESLARALERMRPRPSHYYDAWYHVAYVLSRQKQPQKARQTLQGVMRLSPSLGGADMQKKYKDLLARLSQG